MISSWMSFLSASLPSGCSPLPMLSKWKNSGGIGSDAGSSVSSWYGARYCGESVSYISISGQRERERETHRMSEGLFDRNAFLRVESQAFLEEINSKRFCIRVHLSELLLLLEWQCSEIVS